MRDDDNAAELRALRLRRMKKMDDEVKAAEVSGTMKAAQPEPRPQSDRQKVMELINTEERWNERYQTRDPERDAIKRRKQRNTVITGG